jgi:hypothetical protein
LNAKFGLLMLLSYPASPFWGENVPCFTMGLMHDSTA